MQQSHFCDRWFKNKQSVRAHLRFCEHYQEHLGVDAESQREQEEERRRQEEYDRQMEELNRRIFGDHW